MGNIYGIAAPNALPLAYGPVGAADVTLTAGSEVTFIAAAGVAALNQGDYYPVIWGMVSLVFGVAAPTALVLAFKIGSGSDVDTITVEPGLLVNSTEICIPFMFVGIVSASVWLGSGATVNITGKATTNAATAKAAGTRAIVALMRGPDA
jgi:hypothetical protein